MAIHDVTLVKTPVFPVGKADVVFEIKADEAMLGTLRVSKGAVVWRSKRGKKTYKLSWGQFDALMRVHAPKGYDSAAV